VEIVRLLLAHGAGTEEHDTPSRATPLMLAAEVHKVGTVELLLAHGASVNARDDDGETPLMYAAHYGGDGQEEVIASLLQAGADPELKNDRGERFKDLL
jgi:ankyrin repeat protein